MTEERGWGECGNLECHDEFGWPLATKQKGRDRVCTKCGWTEIGYRSPPEKGWTEVRIRTKVVLTYYPRLKASFVAMLFTRVVGWLSPERSHLKIARVPNLAGKIVWTIIGIPIVVFLEGVPEVVRSYYPEVIRPIKYGKHSSEDVFRRDIPDAEDFQMLWRHK